MGRMTATKPEAVIFAIDGTLIDSSPIDFLRPRSSTEPLPDRYLLESVLCPAHEAALKLLRLEHLMGRRIVITAFGRRDHYLPHTEAWLDRNRAPFHEAVLRPVTDRRPEAMLAVQAARRLQERYEVLHAYEHRPDVARAYGRLGIPVTLTSGAAAPAAAAA